MKTINFLIAVMVGLAFQTTVQAQDPRYVDVVGYDLYGSYHDTITVAHFNNALFDAVIADTTGRAENPNTIYRLKRNHIYQMGKILKPTFHLQIEAEEGDGLLPEIAVGLKTNGKTGNDFIRAYGSLTMKNIFINGNAGSNSHLGRKIELFGTNERVVFKGCAFSHDRLANVVLMADSLKIYMEDCISGNVGYRNISNGNGRFISVRNEYLNCVDTLIVKNCMMYSASDRILRNNGGVINYLEFDHNTFLNTAGRHGGLQMGKPVTAKVTNNIFGNIISYGHTQAHLGEQFQPEQHFAVLTLDTTFASQAIEVRNNNIYWDQEIHDVWAKYDSVSAPWAITPTIEMAIGAENVAKAFFVEPLAFTNMCSNTPAAFVDAYYTDPSNDDLPDMWCVPGFGETGLYHDEIDVSYANTYQSYTADDNGQPVGCQLHFSGLSSIDESASNTSMLEMYPNPVNNGSLTIELAQAGASVVSVYDFTGKMLLQQSTLLDEITLDLKLMKSGLYLVQVDNNGTKTAQKIIIE